MFVFFCTCFNDFHKISFSFFFFFFLGSLYSPSFVCHSQKKLENKIICYLVQLKVVAFFAPNKQHWFTVTIECNVSRKHHIYLTTIVFLVFCIVLILARKCSQAFLFKTKMYYVKQPTSALVISVHWPDQHLHLMQTNVGQISLKVLGTLPNSTKIIQWSWDYVLQSYYIYLTIWVNF